MDSKKFKWKKAVLWGMAGLTVLSTGLVIAALLLLHHPPFRQYVLAKVERSVHESTGAQVRVRDFDLHLSTLSLDLYGLAVHGREAISKEPLLQADHVGLGIGIVSVLHRKWNLKDVVIDHPVARVFVNQAGENNLPVPPAQSGGSQTGIFDLAIQNFLLSHGEIYYNDRKIALDAELRGLLVNSHFDNAQSRYFGDLSYERGRIQYGSYAPMEHGLQAHFDATPARFNLDRLALSTGSSQVTLQASLENYSDPKIRASYDAVLAADDFKRILKNPSLPAGTVRLSGSAAYQNAPGRSLLETLSVAGQVASRELFFKTPGFSGGVRDLAASYKLAGGNVAVEDIHARLLGGRLEGKLTIHDLAGASQARLQASLKDLSIDDLKAASGNRSLRQAALSGRISADANASWAKTLDNLMAHADATLQAALGPQPGQKSAATPLNGLIHADYSAARQEVALKQSYIRTPQTQITLDGKVSKSSQLQVRMTANDLHELELLAAGFQTPASGPPPPSLGLYGSASFTGSVSGSVSNPQIAGQLAASGLRVKGSSWNVLRAGLHASPSFASLSNGELEAVPQGRISFNLQTQLKQWAYTPSSPVAIQVSATQLSVADLERLANQTYPISGTLSVHVALHGTQLNPVGQGSISLANAQVSTEPVQSLNIRFQGTGDAVDATLALKLPSAGTVQGNVTYAPKTQAYQAQLQTTNLRLEKLQTVQARNLPITGGLTLNASGRGTLQDPELEATLQIPELRMEKQTIRGFTLTSKVHNQIATLALDAQMAETYVRANGTVGIKSPYMANARLDTGRIPFRPLLVVYAPSQATTLDGQTEIHATVRGPLQDKSRLEAHVDVPMLSVHYQAPRSPELQLAAAQPIHLDVQNGVAVLQPATIQGTGTDIRMQARVPLDNVNNATFSLLGKLDLRVAQMFEPDLQSTGLVTLDVNARGSRDVEGTIRLENANLQMQDAPVGLLNANGVMNVTRDRLEIASFQGQVGGGVVTAKGGVAFRPAVQFDIALTAKDVRLRYPQGIRTVLGSNLTLTGTTAASALTGQVKIDRVSFTPDFDMSSFISQFSGESSPSPASSAAQSLRLDIAVQSTSTMNLVSSQVSLQGSANLRVAGTAAAPVILGRANLTGGDLFFAGNRYVVDQGTLDFLNPVRTEAVVNLQVSTVVDQYNINLHFQGPMERLRTNYSSDPALPPVDIINLIAFGKTTEASGANPAPSGNLGAESVLAQGIGSAVSGKIQNFAGLSHFSIDPTLGGQGSQSAPGARIAVQQRVTSNIIVTFATDITSTQSQQIQLEYKLNPRWSVSGVRDQNGGFGFDAKYRKSF